MYAVHSHRRSAIGDLNPARSVPGAAGGAGARPEDEGNAGTADFLGFGIRTTLAVTDAGSVPPRNRIASAGECGAGGAVGAYCRRTWRRALGTWSGSTAR
jgi:hypothetical protein